ncbi:hypothetical protein Tco_0701163 [Tanacetum coccineum]
MSTNENMYFFPDGVGGVIGPHKSPYTKYRGEEQMNELTFPLSEKETDEPGPQVYIYSKVMGYNSNGIAEMYGLGVRASDVWGAVPICSARRRDKLR